MKQRILLYTSTEMQVFLDLHTIIYNQDVCDLKPGSDRMWPKAKIVFTIFFFVLESHTKHNNKFVHKKFNLNERIFLYANSKPQTITQGKTFLNK